MNRRVQILIGIITIGILTGCGASTIPVTYQAQNTKLTEGTISIGDVRYIPADNGRVEPNQVKNEAIGKIVLGENVADLVRRANIMEFRHSGGTLSNDADIKIDMYIRRFFAGDLGYRVRWEYEVDYLIYKDGQQVYTSRVELDPLRTGKFGEAEDYEPTVENMIRRGYEKFISDPKVQEILGT